MGVGCRRGMGDELGDELGGRMGRREGASEETHGDVDIQLFDEELLEVHHRRHGRDGQARVLPTPRAGPRRARSTRSHAHAH